MDKKYSVSVEDDEVVSIEIDGVQYHSVEEIPDPVDREKVNELITKTMDDNFERDFNDFHKKFEKDWKETEQKSAKNSVLFVSIFLAIGLILLAIAGFSAVYTLQKMMNEKPAPGQVVDMVERTSTDEGQTNTYYYPVVEFNLPDGTRKHVQLAEGGWPPEFEVGERVTVLYNPNHAIEARIQSTSSTLLQWILPGITGLIGAIFTAVALGMFWAQRKPRDESQYVPPA